MQPGALDKKTLNVPEALWPVFRSHRGSRGEGPAQGELLVAYDVALRVPLQLTLAGSGRASAAWPHTCWGRCPGPPWCSSTAASTASPSSATSAVRATTSSPDMSKRGNPKLLQPFTPKDGLYRIQGGQGRKSQMTCASSPHNGGGFRPVRLVTSLLDPKAFPRDEILQLYHQRWHIETFFRELEGELDFDHWHTRTLKGLYLELLFTMATSRSCVPTWPRRFATSASCRTPQLRPRAERLEGLVPHPPMHTRAGPALRRELLDLLPTLRIDIRPDAASSATHRSAEPPRAQDTPKP